MKLKLFLIPLISVICSIAILGCASKETKNTVAAEKEHQRAIDKKTDQLQDVIDSLPSWAKTPPKPDGIGMFAVGIADSDNLQIAIQKAQLQAEFGLAKMYQQELSGSERLYNTDNASGASVQFQGLIDKLVQRVPVVGFTVKEQKISAVNGKFQVLTLLQLPYDEFNQVLKNQKAKEQTKDMKDAFEDLERRLEKRRLEGKESAVVANNLENNQPSNLALSERKENDE